MKRALVGLVVLAAISSCRLGSDPGNHDIYDARAAVRDQLVDPGSARFRGDRVIGSFASRYVCGEVNSLDPSGRYSGFQRYIFVPELEKVRVLPISGGRLKSFQAGSDIPRECRA